MITPSLLPAQQDCWKNALANAISDPAVLLERLALPRSLLPAARVAAAAFPLRVTEHYLGLIEKGNPEDPLLRQVLPLAAELQEVPGFVTDPVGDSAAQQAPGVLQKYHGRALLITTGACAIHCRYCFRRNFPYAQQSAARHWEQLPEHLGELPHLKEVILSGGDPLTLSDEKLDKLVRRLSAVPGLQRLRLHSRTPSVLPSRITPQLVDLLRETPLVTTLVLHCNHARELAEPLDKVLETLRQAGVTLLNQAVLLRGVNDSLSALQDLSERLFEFGVLPYYLHALDPVQGAAHFNVPDREASHLHQQLQQRLPGYLVPRLVREIPGEACKTPL